MNKHSGFTLIEIIIVIAIMSVLLAIVVPNYIKYKNNRQVTKAAGKIYADLQLAKTTAIKDNTDVNVLFTPGSGTAAHYVVFEDANGDNAFNSGDTLIARGRMPSGVEIKSASFAGVAHSTRFTSIGLTTGENGTVVLTNGHRTARIVVNIVGGIRID